MEGLETLTEEDYIQGTIDEIREWERIDAYTDIVMKQIAKTGLSADEVMDSLEIPESYQYCVKKNIESTSDR